MKRLLIATLALTLLTACGNESETEDTSADTSNTTKNTVEGIDKEMTEEEAREIIEGSELYRSSKESSEAYEDAVEEYNSEDEPSELDKAIENITEKREKQEDKVDEMASEYDSVKLSGADSIIHTESDVTTAIGSVVYFPGPNSHIKVYFTVKNNSSETVPLLLTDTVLVTDDGVQLEYDRINSEYPETKLRPNVEDNGFIYFSTRDVPSVDENTDVTVYVPGVGYNYE